MILQWRKREYTFRPAKYVAHPDGEKNADFDKPFLAIDTETFTHPVPGGRCEPITYQVSGPDGEWLGWLAPNETAIESIIDALETRYHDLLTEHKIIFMWCHNLLFDWGQMVKNRADLMVLLRTGIGCDSPIKICDLSGGGSAWLRKGGLFEGTSPFFEIEIRWTKRNKAIIKWRDTYSYFPASLERLGEMLQLPSLKLARPDELGTVDYRLLPDTDIRKQSFVAYGLRDPLTTKLVAEQIRLLHEQVSIRKIRVSAPSYAIAYLLHTTKRGTEFVTGPDDPAIMQLVVDCYAGGRTGGIHHGPVSNMGVYDFHSSYPASMTTLPSFSPTMEYLPINPKEYTAADLVELIDTVPCFLRVSGIETDTRYPALIQNINNNLTPVSGVFRDVPTTGIELATGIKSGTIIDWNISELVVLLETDDNAPRPFRDFAISAYDRKQNSEKASPDYTSAKLVLNSSYGKLIESRSETHIAGDDDGIMVPVDSSEINKWANMYFSDYVAAQLEQPGCDYYERIKNDLEAMADTIPESKLVWMALGMLNLQKLEYGRYAIPAAAALITATSRARLRVAMRGLGALYWDTDSVFVVNMPSDAAERLAAESLTLPGYAQPVTIGDKLGELGSEIENAHGYLAGVKRYWLWDGSMTENKKTGKLEKDNIKSAIHGLAGLPWEQRETALRQLATGAGMTYESRARPVTPKSAKNADALGRFESREYEPEFRLDPRLSWEYVDGAYYGHVLPWERLKRKEMELCEE